MCGLIYYKVRKQFIFLNNKIDEINPKYRRIIVRSDYKVLYREEAGIIKVLDIVSVKQSPEILKNK